jgi:dihydroflavonol-4-reductase
VGVKTLITGATGFVGSALLRRLLARGHRVRALVRPGADRRNLAGLPVEEFPGDLGDSDSLDRALEGCRFLFHVAADYRLWVREPEPMYATNVAGTRNLMLSALRHAVERVVYTSSVATLGLRADHRPADESTPSALEHMVGHYKRSKFLAEEAVRELVREKGLPAVIVNPSTPVGPRDLRPTPTGRVIVDAVNGRMPAYVDTGLNLVHVDDVAEGHILALERGRPGERYVLGGQDMALREILVEVASIVGRKPPRLRLPHELVLPLAYVCEAWSSVTGGCEPRVTVDGVRMAKKFMFFSSEKAQRELGYTSRPARMGLEDAVCWFRENGYCR